jgi:hypothetical protein
MTRVMDLEDEWPLGFQPPSADDGDAADINLIHSTRDPFF